MKKEIVEKIDDLMEIVDELYDEIIIYDDCYNIVYVNKACERHYNVSQEEMIGRSFFDFITHQEQSWDCSILPVVYENKKPYMAYQRTINGNELVTIAKPIIKDGKIKYVAMSVRDKIKDITVYNPSYLCKNTCEEKDVYYKSYNEEMRKIISLAEKISKINVSCIITGESGTGKTKLAKYIHAYGDRKNEVFMSINCANIPENLVESELFGYEKGAFTGANKEGKKGMFEIADKGTVLLDEIGELSLTVQAKLLHFLQEKRFKRVGGSENISVDVRVIAATNKNLEEMVESNKFRKDLYYRLNVVELYLPPLRERKEDIYTLVMMFLKEFNHKYSLNKKISHETFKFLEKEKWYGNIRELRHKIERAVITSERDMLEIEDFTKRKIKEEEKIEISDKSYDEYLEEFNKQLINEYYRKNNSSRKLAKTLRISQTKANNLIKKYVKN